MKTRVVRSLTCHFHTLIAKQHKDTDTAKTYESEIGKQHKSLLKMESKALWIVTLLLCGTIHLAICRSEEKITAKTMKLGGVHDLRGNQNNEEIESLARFAIQEHNKQQVFESSVFDLVMDPIIL